MVNEHGQPKIMIQRKNKLRNLKDLYSTIGIPRWKTQFSLCLRESCSANIRTFEVPSWILFDRFHWLKPHYVLSKYFRTRIGCILSSRNDTFCLECANNRKFGSWKLICPMKLDWIKWHFINIVNFNNILLFKTNSFFL